MSHIHLITGGERSGKSSYAERLALERSENPIYLATARVWDEEFRERVRLHQERRTAVWQNIEEEKHPSRHPLSERTVLLDCVTLWATNYFFDMDNDVDAALEAIKDELESMLALEADWIIVTNEIGLGGVSIDPIQRKFTTLQGWLNQHIASLADEVTLMISGIPVKIK